MRGSSSMTAALAALALAAGCGGDTGGDNPDRGGGEKPAATEGKATQAGGRAAATAFIGCFDERGYEARRPKPREESLFAYQAKRKGYAVDAVNVAKPESIAASAFLAFFDSRDNARKAMDELAVTAVGDVPPQLRATAVIGFLDEEERRATQPAIDRCLR